MQQNCALYPPALPVQHVIIFRLCAGHKRFRDPRALRLVLAGAPAGKNTQTSGAVRIKRAWKRLSGEPSPGVQGPTNGMHPAAQSPSLSAAMTVKGPDCVKTRKLSENGASGANFFALPSL